MGAAVGARDGTAVGDSVGGSVGAAEEAVWVLPRMSAGTSAPKTASARDLEAASGSEWVLTRRWAAQSGCPSARYSATDDRLRSGGSTSSDTGRMCQNQRPSTCCRGSPRKSWLPFSRRICRLRSPRMRSALLLPAPCPRGSRCSPWIPRPPRPSQQRTNRSSLGPFYLGTCRDRSRCTTTPRCRILCPQCSHRSCWLPHCSRAFRGRNLCMWTIALLTSFRARNRCTTTPRCRSTFPLRSRCTARMKPRSSSPRCRQCTSLSR